MTKEQAIKRLEQTKDFFREERKEKIKECKIPELIPVIKKTYSDNMKVLQMAIDILKGGAEQWIISAEKKH